MAVGDVRLKRLLYRASHRGTREMDLILTAFVGHYSAAENGRHLDFLEWLCDQNDEDIAAWMRRARVPPYEPQHLLWARLASFSVRKQAHE